MMRISEVRARLAALFSASAVPYLCAGALSVGFEKGEENFIFTQEVMGVAKACIKAEESASRGGEFLRIE